jgi:hypothetical protein
MPILLPRSTWVQGVCLLSPLPGMNREFGLARARRLATYARRAGQTTLALRLFQRPARPARVPVQSVLWRPKTMQNG